MQDPGVFWPWSLATLLFLIVLGGGRTIRGRWLGRPPFGAGVVLSVALGVMLYSLDLLVLGHRGALGSPWPQLLLAIGALIALPGLWWTWQDFRDPAPGLDRGFEGLGWFAGGAWFLLITAVLVSMVWISGAFGWEGRGFLFERVGIDYEIGRIASDPEQLRDPFLGSEPLSLWLYALGSAEASLAFAWWLGIALLFGVWGLAWRLHSHGAGLLAAALFAIVLFATDRPLLLAPALPATVALLAIMVLAVESRGRPNIAFSLVAGLLGGFALISDFGALAMLLPLLFFGPFWCKWATGLDQPGNARDLAGEEDLPAEPSPSDGSLGDGGYTKFGDESKGGWGKTWVPPLRHTAIGLVGLTIPLAPWLLRNDAWADDPFYAVRDDFRNEYAQRFVPEYELGYDLQIEYRLGRQLIDFGDGALSDVPALDSYLEATEWGLGLGVVTAFGLGFGPRKRRRQTLLYGATATAGYSLGATFGGFELTHPSSLGLLAVTAGSSLRTFGDCAPPWKDISFGGTLATGSLAIGLSGAADCGYWDEKIEPIEWTPSIRSPLGRAYYDEWKVGASYRLPDPDEPRIELRYDTPDLGPGADPEVALDPESDAGSAAVPSIPTTDPQETPGVEYKLPPKRPVAPGYKPDIRPDVHIKPPSGNYPQGQRPTPRVRPGYRQR